MSQQPVVHFSHNGRAGCGRMFVDFGNIELTVTVRGPASAAEQLRLIDRALTAAKLGVSVELVRLRDAERKET